MGDAAKKVGGSLSSMATGGAYSTTGKGWAQGGSLKDVMGNTMFLGYGKEVFDALGNKVNVPDAQMKPEWMLSGADGKLRSDLLLGNSMPVAAGQSQDTLNNLITRANSTGPSQSAQYLQGANMRTMNNNLDNADALNRGQMASATSNMAMRGGSDAGSRERMGKAFGAEAMMNKQRIMNDAAGRDMEILAKDEDQKTQIMQSLPTSLLAQAGFEQGQKQFDITNTLGTLGNKYQNDMSGWAANQAAREQAQLANKKNGLLGLGIGGIL